MKANGIEAEGQKYLKTLLQYYEDEISGESYFYGLVDHFKEQDKLVLLAKVERHAARTIRPLLTGYNLTPRPEFILAQEGIKDATHHVSMKWPEFIHYMIDHYPKYLDDFAALEDMAPAKDLDLLKKLTEHEFAAIEFAKREACGDADSMLPLQRYLSN